MLRGSSRVCVALAGLVACGGGVAGIKQRSNNGQLKITWDGGIPVFSWKPCTAFGLKNCKPDEYKVQGVSVAPLNCTSTGKLDGERKTTYSVTPNPGAFLTPPLKYGDHPENTNVGVAPKLYTGCKYTVTIQVADGSTMGIWINDEFEVN